jgi:hypothetical protein
MTLPSHAGETAIILGNGPSLRTFPRAFLESCPTFGANYVHRLPFQPTYYICIDTRILTTDAAEITSVAAGAKLAFISSYIPPNLALDNLRSLPNVRSVGRDTFVFSNERFMSGNTCVYVALKIAYFMGFTRALMVGVDHTQTFQHFTDNYPAAQCPNFEGMRYHFRIAEDVWSSAGRQIINLSPPSELDNIFMRSELTKAE